MRREGRHQPLSCFSVESFLASKRHLDLSGCYTIEHIERLGSYQEWLQSIEAGLQHHGYTAMLSSAALQYFLFIIRDSQHIVLLRNEAEIIEYSWPNKERKLVPIWQDQFILQQDTNWLSHYPFIHPCNEQMSRIIIDRGMVKSLPLSTGNCNLMLSHNDHFGHFLADNFPSIAFLLMSPLRNIITHTLAPVSGHKNGIYSLFQLIRNLPNNPIFSEMDNLSKAVESISIIDVPLLAEVVPSSLCVSMYIWSRIKEKIINSLTRPVSSIGSPSKIWLVRSGSYQSRVSNHDELSLFLESEGFVSLDPCDFEINELATIINGASFVVAEAGSTTLNAAFFANPDSRVLSLCSERFFQYPSIGMIMGGLPYLLCFANQVRPVLGRAIINSPIESSDICEYSISDVHKALTCSDG
jgi:hypothetical protein